jgi:hypothetical protein
LEQPVGLSVFTVHEYTPTYDSEHTQIYRLLEALPTYPSLNPYKLATILYIGDEKRVGRLFYTVLLYVMMGQQGLKHVGICVLKHYCNSTEVFALIGHIVTIKKIYWCF